MERSNLQITIINATATQRRRWKSPDTHNGKMHDPLYPENGEARTTGRHLYSRLAQKMAPTWKNTKPPRHKRIPTNFDYLYRYNIEAAYKPTRETFENQMTYRKRLHKGLLTSIYAADGIPEMRVHKLWPDTDWIQVWKNLSEASVSENMRRVWYQVIHDLIPPNVRLHRINVTPSYKCQRCAATDTLEHLLTVCGEGRVIRQYTKTILARMLRTIPARIPSEWLLRPHFKIWPSKRNLQYYGL